MQTKSSVIINALRIITGKGHGVYNDAMLNGGRSFKVRGWGEMEYGRAQALMFEAGFTAKIVTTPAGRMRLHVFENNA